MSCMSRETDKMHIVCNCMFNEFNVVDMQAVAIKNQNSMLCDSLSRT